VVYTPAQVGMFQLTVVANNSSAVAQSQVTIIFRGQQKGVAHLHMDGVVTTLYALSLPMRYGRVAFGSSNTPTR
jgi:hypothetical protein